MQAFLCKRYGASADTDDALPPEKDTVAACAPKSQEHTLVEAAEQACGSSVCCASAHTAQLHAPGCVGIRVWGLGPWNRAAHAHTARQLASTHLTVDVFTKWPKTSNCAAQSAHAHTTLACGDMTRGEASTLA